MRYLFLIFCFLFISCNKISVRTFLPKNTKKLRTNETTVQKDDISIDPVIDVVIPTTDPKDQTSIPKDDNYNNPKNLSNIQIAREIFTPIVKNNYDRELSIVVLEDDETINASASKGISEWTLELFGGLFTIEGMTQDSISVILCHEIGHLIAGFPGVGISNDSIDYMSVEGNSDYFASQACLRKLWENENNKKTDLTQVPEFLLNQCSEKFEDQDELLDICNRTMAAIKDLQSIFVDTSLTEPSIAQTEITLDFHPDFQCRIDTYIAGTLCNKPWDFQSNWPTNKKSLDAISCTRNEYTNSIYDGVRPKCWYQPDEIPEIQ